MAATDEAAPAEAVPPVSSAEGGAAVASFLSEAGLDSALGPPLCAALAQHGDDPGTWVPTLIAMPADTFDELIQSVKDHDPAGEDGSSPASAGELPSTREMVVQIFNAIDEDKDERLKFAECVQLAVRTGGTMDKGTYDEVAAMVGAAGEEGLTLSNLEDVYVKFKMGDVAEDWSKITGNALPARAPDGPAQAGAAAPSAPAAARAGEGGPAATRAWLLTELQRLRGEPFSWENAEHAEQLGRVWAAAAPPSEAITATERMLLPRRLELLVSLPLFMGFGSRMAQVRLANALEEVEFDDGANILTEGEPTSASSCMYCVVAGNPVAMSAEIGTLKVYQVGEWFGERGIVMDEPRSASVIANAGTRCLRLSRARVAEVMHNNLAGLEAHFEDVEAKYQARKAQLEGALEYDISSRALHIKFSGGSAAGGGSADTGSADAADDGRASTQTLKTVAGRLAAECKLLPADGGTSGSEAGAMTTAPKGAMVNVLAAKGAWWEVELQESGERGFVAARMVSVGAGGSDEDDASRLARRVALLRRSVRVLDGLPDIDVKLLAMCLDSVVVGECEPLLKRGEYPSSLLLVEAGSAESRDPETGEVLATLGPGDCVCEEELVLLQPCATSTMALTDVVCLELRRADLVGLLSDRWEELEQVMATAAAPAMNGHVAGQQQREDLRVHDWTDIGFQNRSPDTDFRAMGSLALQCLDHFATRKPSLMRQIVLAYQADRATHYPPAITAVNITQWLLEMADDDTLASSHFDPPTELAVGMRVYAVADDSDTGEVTELEASHGGHSGGHMQCKVRLDAGRVRTYFAADVAIAALPTDGHSVYTFCERFCDLYERFDLYWQQARPTSVMEFPGVSDEFRSREAVRWARDKRQRREKLLAGSMNSVAAVGTAVGGVASVGGAAVGGVAAVGGMGAAVGKAAVGRLGTGMKGLRRKASSALIGGADEGGGGGGSDGATGSDGSK